MRNRFEQQLTLGQIPIEQTYINPKRKFALDELLAALKAIYCNPEYNEKIFSILEKSINAGKHRTGRKGMDLWCIFVLAQVRLCLDLNYEMLHNLANNHRTLRQLMGVEREFGYEPVEFEYQTLYENVSMVSDELVAELNHVIVEFGQGEVFKKKENTVFRSKTDSPAVKSKAASVIENYLMKARLFIKKLRTLER
jgi:IS5 family transposase